MTSTTRRTAFVVAGVLAIVAASPMRAEIIERVLVKVNGEIFTKTELEHRQVAAVRERAAQKIDIGSLKNDAALKKVLLDVTPQILVDAIDEMLLMQLGKEKGLKLSDDQFKSWLENLRKSQDLLDDTKFQAALKQEGMTVEELRKNVEKNFIVGQVQRDEVGVKLQITEEEARQYYLAHKEEFREPSKVTLREIFVEVPTSSQKGQAGISVASDDDAARRAEGVRTRIAAGEDFGKLATELSSAGSKANGGLIGPIAMPELSPALQQLLGKMKPGEITQTLKVPRGYQILKLESMTASVVPPFEGVRDIAADKVHEARQETEVKKFLARMRGQAIIEWKSDELKQMYEKQLATLTAQPVGGQ